MRVLANSYTRKVDRIEVKKKEKKRKSCAVKPQEEGRHADQKNSCPEIVIENYPFAMGIL